LWNSFTRTKTSGNLPRAQKPSKLFLIRVAKVAVESQFTREKEVMTLTGLIRSLGEKVFLAFVVLCLVGVFSSVSFAEEATKQQPAPETPAAEIPHSEPPGKIERAGQATGKGIEKGAEATKRGVQRAGKATGKGIEKGAKATARGVKRAGKATGEGIKKAGEAIEKTFSGD
jgi:hypothetical protein